MSGIIKDQKGTVLMFAALTMPLLLGAAGLAVDTVQWTLWKRQLQRQADSAAMAGAFARTQVSNVQSTATADIARNMTVPFSAPPVIENAPTRGSYAGNARAVRVVLQTQQSLPFSSIFLKAPPVIVAVATAAAVSQGNYCMIALETNAVAAITMQGNATVNMGCGMASNSKGSNAVEAGGSSVITATPVSAVGGLQASSNYASPTTLLPYSAPQDDPFAHVPVPAVSGCGGNVNVGPNSTRTLNPGCFSGMDLKGTVTLNPGIYYIDGGSLDFGSQAVVTGDNVTFVLTSSNAATNPSLIGALNINGGATVNLTASTSGPFAGILFYQDPRATNTKSNIVNGNSTSKYQGAIYMPRQTVQFNGTAGMNTECIQIVARRIVFSGNSTIANQCPSGSGAQSFVGTRVRLVG
ncbi:pilus assembly protein TadG-related protein [Sphingorhabdus sp.]|uniref:pilus assembly protein TadG-related protein n=1 Tax=Sphingorhabdus sp. TaxID=1902408 RepID=UPI00391A5C5E